MNGGIWGILVILGPILLIGIVVWASLRSRGASRRKEIRSERGAAELREGIERGTPPPRT